MKTKPHRGGWLPPVKVNKSNVNQQYIYTQHKTCLCKFTFLWACVCVCVSVKGSSRCSAGVEGLLCNRFPRFTTLFFPLSHCNLASWRVSEHKTWASLSFRLSPAVSSFHHGTGNERLSCFSFSEKLWYIQAFRGKTCAMTVLLKFLYTESKTVCGCQVQQECSAAVKRFHDTALGGGIRLVLHIQGQSNEPHLFEQEPNDRSQWKYFSIQP